MKIIMLMGSPNRNGSTGILVENFKKEPKRPGIRWKSLMAAALPA